MFAVLKFFYLLLRGSWDVTNPNLNPMRYAPPYVKYVASILLGCFWSLAFGLYTAQFLFIGYNMIGHIAIISMMFVTWYTFKHFKNMYEPRSNYLILRDPGFSPKCYEMTDAEKLQALHNSDRLLAKQKNSATL
jgi:hypothetical protein